MFKPRKMLWLVLCVLGALATLAFLGRGRETAIPVAQSSAITSPRKYLELPMLESDSAGMNAASKVTSAKPSGSIAAQKEARSEPARIAPSIDWKKYPGTLNAQINQAMEKHDGEMAMDLANKLTECDIASRLQRNSLPQNGEREKDASALAERNKQQQQYQRIISDCQTIAGNLQEVKSRLLDVAVERNVVGAAAESFALGSRSAEVLRGVIADAVAGDVKSLMYVSASRASVFGIDADTQNVARYALSLAAADPTVGKVVHPYLGIAESLSVPLGGEAKPKFDFSTMNDELRARSQAIVSRLVNRAKNAGGSDSSTAR